MADEIAIAQYKALCERLSAPPKEPEPELSRISKRQEYWQDRANDLSLQYKKSMAVVELDHDHYQVHPLSVCGKNHVYVAEYVAPSVGEKVV